MSKLVLEECFSLREAIDSVKNRLLKEDDENLKNREFWQKNDPSRLKESMEEENWSDTLYLVYRNDNYDDTFFIFKDDHDIACWLEEKWTDWDLWDYDNIQSFFDEDLVVWEFHRNICIEKWDILYRNSKPFLEGWSRKREYVDFETVPSFSIG